MRSHFTRRVPLLGLCVGMQLFFESSEEDPDTPGLGFLRGSVRRLENVSRVPHTGWNTVRIRIAHPWLARVPEGGGHFYFVHSYAAHPDDDVVLATAEHGGEIAAIVGDDGLLGVQFHPEKSARMGQRLLEGFVRGIGES